ncbi:MAG: phytanoyl-CoA dioxygenase [Alphaproteobacteria bacterium]|nr:phytanoyl-CoA dioxygenase [Alphaproteobacteria bacterium]
MQAERGFTDSDIADYEADGAVCLRQCFPARWIDALAAGFERNMADPGPNASCFTPAGNPGGYFDDFGNWNRIAEYRAFVFDSPAAGIAGGLMRSRTARLFLENMLIKEPGTLEASPWHQDLPYYCVDGAQLCSVWVPLDPVPRSACVEFVAGSHRWGKLFTPRRFGDHSEYSYPAGTFVPAPDVESERERHRILSWDVMPGDCIVFHMRSLHRAPATAHLTTRRRAFSTRWIGDDAIYAVRPGKMYPDVPEPRPAPGQPFDHPDFPVVWRG